MKMEAVFSHIYVERRVLDHFRTRNILAKFPGSSIIPIEHYKDVFNRRKQDYSLQHASNCLILAQKDGEFIYPGAPVCQDFGNSHFYYSASMLNCVYNCEYCYLKGKYPSAYPVIFVNIEDFFAQTEDLLRKDPVYLCVSYDCDMIALEGIAGYTRLWSEFAGSLSKARKDCVKGLTIEMRTKCANVSLWDELMPYDNVIYAFTLSPQQVIGSFEHGTPSLKARLDCVRAGLEKGFPIRLCFDPMVLLPDWRNIYAEMLKTAEEAIDIRRIRDFSVGTFRVSADYLKQMRKAQPWSAVVQYPFVKRGGYYSYDSSTETEMEQLVISWLLGFTDEKHVFSWNGKIF